MASDTPAREPGRTGEETPPPPARPELAHPREAIAGLVPVLRI